MKEFIYLNTDYINSFLAQKYNGLPTFNQKQSVDGKKESKKEEINGQTHKRGFELSLFKLIGYNAEITPEQERYINELSNFSFGKEMINKALHDNSYDLFVEDIDSEKYVTIEDYMRIYDLKSLSSIMENEFMDAYKLNLPTSEDFLKGLNREERRKTHNKKKAEKMEKEHKEELKGIDYAIKFINLLSRLFPSDVYIYTRNYFIPFKRNFFREEISSINYIYTSKTKILGRVTGTIGNVLRHKNDNEFNEAVNSLNDISIEGLKVLGINEDAKILIPISWYHE